MSWLQLRLDADPALTGQLEDLMLATGAAAVTLEDNANQPVLEPGVGETPLWQHTRITGLYAADTDMDTVRDTFPANLLGQCNCRVEILEDKDWEREWMQHYRPMQFGGRLWVCPSWLEPPDPDAISLLLDPGLAFGTGTHPTTALCLEQIALTPTTGATVLDYGCGSGILAVAALKLGAAAGIGIDNDPQALVACRENARRNGIPDTQLDVLAPGQVTVDHEQYASLLVANILAGPLVQLRDTLLNLMQPGATLLLSGLLDSQAPALIEHYESRLQLTVAAEREHWVCLSGTLAN